MVDDPRHPFGRYAPLTSIDAAAHARWIGTVAQAPAAAP